MKGSHPRERWMIALLLVTNYEPDLPIDTDAGTGS